ncbi:MAG: hypothetical protein AAF680_00185 [Pseudomonadota bacterium]
MSLACARAPPAASTLLSPGVMPHLRFRQHRTNCSAPIRVLLGWQLIIWWDHAMQLVSSSEGAKRASISPTFVGGKHVLKVGGKKYKLPDDIEKTRITQEQNEMTGWRMLLIIILAITVVGILLAIPLYFAGKKKRVVMAIKAKDGHTFSVSASNNKESKMLQQYSGVGVFD